MKRKIKYDNYGLTAVKGRIKDIQVIQKKVTQLSIADMSSLNKDDRDKLLALANQMKTITEKYSFPLESRLSELKNKSSK